jgi:hypothetical protein
MLHFVFRFLHPCRKYWDFNMNLLGNPRIIYRNNSYEILGIPSYWLEKNVKPGVPKILVLENPNY